VDKVDLTFRDWLSKKFSDQKYVISLIYSALLFSAKIRCHNPLIFLTPMSAALPKAYLESMRHLLVEEYSSFYESYNQPPLNGLRVNTLKITIDRFKQISPFDLQPISFCQEGFIVPEQARAGKHPYHAAGLYYLQEPSAMAVVDLLDPHPGENVLDLAAAPGGKATHIATRMANQGLLIANDLHPKRVRELAQNMERFGVRNCCILNETPQRLSEKLEGFFDKVLLDAPCSGEGMFRKSENARQDWSPETVRSCAVRQAGILPPAARMVKPGGRLVYSTCTFNPQENEQVIANFLHENSSFTLEQVVVRNSFSPGRPEWVEDKTKLPDLRRAVRIWPHLVQGEGHFIAVMRRNTLGRRIPWKTMPVAKPSAQNMGLFNQFVEEGLAFSFDRDTLWEWGSYLYQVPRNLPDMRGLKLIHPGWWLGVMKKGWFEPAHALVMGLAKEYVQRSVEFGAQAAEIGLYMRGAPLSVKGVDMKVKGEGWCPVLVDGYPLGWGKISGEVLKNSYPKGLRIFA
jgi:NOL1/NOP2/sun family putative RNA methylase